MRERPYTPASLAMRWQCSARTVTRMVDRGELPCFRIGKLLRISVEAVENYEQCGSSGTETPSAPTGEKTNSRIDGRSGIRIVESPSDA